MDSAYGYSAWEQLKIFMMMSGIFAWVYVLMWLLCLWDEWAEKKNQINRFARDAQNRAQRTINEVDGKEVTIVIPPPTKPKWEKLDATEDDDSEDI